MGADVVIAALEPAEHSIESTLSNIDRPRTLLNDAWSPSSISPSQSSSSPLQTLSVGEHNLATHHRQHWRRPSRQRPGRVHSGSHRSDRSYYCRCRAHFFFTWVNRGSIFEHPLTHNCIPGCPLTVVHGRVTFSSVRKVTVARRELQDSMELLHQHRWYSVSIHRSIPSLHSVSRIWSPSSICPSQRCPGIAHFFCPIKDILSR